MFIDELRPVTRTSAAYIEGGNYLASSPLLVCNNEDFASLNRFLDSAGACQLEIILSSTFDSVEHVILHANEDHDPFIRTRSLGYTGVDLNEAADCPNPPRNVTSMLVQACALASRIYFRTLEREDETRDEANGRDAKAIYDLLRFLGLKSFTGLPYIYLWL
jgi:hypothetical protein